MVHTWPLFLENILKRQDQASVACPPGFLDTQAGIIYRDSFGEKTQMHTMPRQRDGIYAGGRGGGQFVDIKTKKCKEQTESEDTIAAHVFIFGNLYSS